jgi:hypothetical protein
MTYVYSQKTKFYANLLYRKLSTTFATDYHTIMAHHQIEKKAKDLNLYYVVGLLAGLFTGAVIDFSIIYLVTGAVVGLLFAAFFQNALVKGREDI